MTDTPLIKLKSIPIDGVECVTVDGSIRRITLPGGIEISCPYGLEVHGPAPVELKAKLAVDPDHIPF